MVIIINVLHDLYSLVTRITRSEQYKSLEQFQQQKKFSISYKTMSTFRTLYIKELNVSPMKIFFTIEKHTERPSISRDVPLWLRIIPTVSMTQYNLTAFNMRDFNSSIDALVAKLDGHYTKQLKSNFANAFMLADYYKANAFEGSLRHAENIFNVAANVLRNVSSEDTITGKKQGRIGLNQSSGDTVKQGFISLGQGIVGGVAGVFLDPIKQAEKEGAKGFFKGLGTGITGIVTKPVLGTIDAAQGLIVGTRKAVDKNKDEVYHRQRNARTILMRRVTEFNHDLADAQYNMQISDVFEESYNETAEFIFNISGIRNANIVILTLRCMYFFNNMQCIDRRKYKTMKGLHITDDGIVVIDKNKFHICDESLIVPIKIFLSTKV